MLPTYLRDIPIRLAPPTPVPTVVDIPDGEPNLLPKEALLAPLRVEFPVWEGAVTDPADTGDTLYLYWDGVQVDVKLFKAGDVVPGNLFMTVPRAYLNGDGEHELQYVAHNSVGNPVGSFPAPVWVDTTEPGHNDVLRAILADPPVPGDIVNEAYLLANGDQLVAQVPDYRETRVGDVIQGFWRHDLSEEHEDPADAQTVVDKDAIEAGTIALVFAGSTIRGKGNGRATCWYRITDRAGNVSARSDEKQWLVDVQAPPSSLRPPRIPQADDGLVSRADACDKVMVVLDGYSVPVPGDELLVMFNSTPLPPVPAPTPGSFPVSVEVPWDILQVYGETALYHAVVTWQVRRGAFLTPPSTPLNVDVDLRIPGPPNPSPCPYNAQLPSVTVKGSTGDNRIVSADAPGPVPVEVMLYTPVNEHELLELFWGELPAPVADYEVMAGDVPGITITFQVPWASILAAGADPALPVAYTVSNGVNAQRSPTTSCEVDLAVEDATLPAPFYPEPDGYVGPPQWELLIGNVNCSAHPWRGLDIIVPADERFKEGDRVVLQWKGYSSSNLSESTALPGTVERYEKVVPPWTKDKNGRLAPQPIPFVIPPEHFRRCILPASYRGQGPGQRAMGSGYAWYTLYSAGLPAIHNRHKASYCTIDLIRPNGSCPCTWDRYPDEAEDWCVDCDPSTDPGCTPAP